MKKILFTLCFFFLSFSSLKADYLYSLNNECINDYYYLNSNFYYKKSIDNLWYSSIKSNQEFIYTGFEFDFDTQICKQSTKGIELGLSSTQYLFLLALTGLLTGFAFLFGFINIMGRR